MSVITTIKNKYSPKNKAALHRAISQKIEQNPNSINAHIALATWQMLSDELETAERLVNKVLATQKTREALLLKSEIMLYTIEGNEQLNIEPLEKYHDSVAIANRFQAGLNILNAVNKAGETPESLLLLARYQASNSENTTAKTTLTKVLNANPELIEARKLDIEWLHDALYSHDETPTATDYHRLLTAHDELLKRQNTAENRVAHIDTLSAIANRTDEAHHWQAYQTACLAFLSAHHQPIDQHYVDILEHYAQAVSEGMLEAFNQQHAMDIVTDMLKGSKAEQWADDFSSLNNSAESKIAQLDKKEQQLAKNTEMVSDFLAGVLIMFPRMQQTLPYEIRSASLDETGVLKKAFYTTTMTWLQKQGFDTPYIGRHIRLEKARQDQLKHYLVGLKRGTTLAAIGVGKNPTLNKLATLIQWFTGKLYHKQVTFTTYFDNDTMYISFNQPEIERMDTPDDIIADYGTTDLAQLLNQHEQRVADIEQSQHCKALDLSIEASLEKDEAFTTKLLAFKKSVGFLTYDEFKRFTKIDSKLAYAIALNQLASAIEDEFVDGDGPDLQQYHADGQSLSA